LDKELKLWRQPELVKSSRNIGYVNMSTGYKLPTCQGSSGCDVISASARCRQPADRLIARQEGHWTLLPAKPLYLMLMRMLICKEPEKSGRPQANSSLSDVRTKRDIQSTGPLRIGRRSNLWKRSNGSQFYAWRNGIADYILVMFASIKFSEHFGHLFLLKTPERANVSLRHCFEVDMVLRRRNAISRQSAQR
jgi:hypothetical protein